MPSCTGHSSSLPTLRVDGQPVQAATSSLLAVSVEATDEWLSRCDLTLTHWGRRRGSRAPGYLWFDGVVFALSKPLAVSPGLGQVFDGLVMGLGLPRPPRCSAAVSSGP